MLAVKRKVGAPKPASVPEGAAGSGGGALRRAGKQEKPARPAVAKLKSTANDFSPLLSPLLSPLPSDRPEPGRRADFLECDLTSSVSHRRQIVSIEEGELRRRRDGS
jgi:hypothetical protein